MLRLAIELRDGKQVTLFCPQLLESQSLKLVSASQDRGEFP